MTAHDAAVREQARPTATTRDPGAARMKTYGQYCATARALDLVGDRWVLLIVRELLIHGPSRFTDLRGGLTASSSASMPRRRSPPACTSSPSAGCSCRG